METFVKENTGGYANHKSNDLIIRQGRGENADTHKCSRQEQ
jgi:hypothetical protein